MAVADISSIAAANNSAYGQTPSSGGNINDVYQSNLAQWLAQQKAAKGIYDTAAKPLTEMQKNFASGGTWETNQMNLVNQELKNASAAGNASAVASGMSSGSQAVGLKARLGGEAAKAKTGVETARVSNLGQIAQNLASLRAGQASNTMNAVNPYAAPYTSALVGSESNAVSAGNNANTNDAAIQQLIMQLNANRQNVLTQTQSQQQIASEGNTAYLQGIGQKNQIPEFIL